MPIADENVLDAGDVLWIDFGRPVGREQGGRRPALILTPQEYNRTSSVVLAMPITRTRRDWPFQVELPSSAPVGGFVLIDQVRVVHPAMRHTKLAGKIAPETLQEVRGVLAALLAIPVSN
jgi:mRNA interferase MazF